MNQLGIRLFALCGPAVWLWAMSVQPADTYEVQARSLLRGHMPPATQDLALSPMSSLVLLVPTVLQWLGLSYAKAFVAMSLAFDACAKWRAANAVVVREVPFWLAMACAGIWILPQSLHGLHAVAGACCLMAFVAWSETPEGWHGWAWLAVAIGISLSALALLPVGIMWCRERGGRWFDVAHGITVTLIGVALPLMLFGLVWGERSFVFWQQTLVDGFSPMSLYAAASYVFGACQQRFSLGRIAAEWIVLGDRPLAWARIAPVIVCMAQGMVVLVMWRDRERAAAFHSVRWAVLCGTTLILTLPRGGHSALAWTTSALLLWSTQEATRVRVGMLFVWCWAMLCLAQVRGQVIAMAHGRSALQLWLCIFFGCVAWVLVGVLIASERDNTKPKSTKRVTWVVPNRRRAKR